jgi:acyl-CoA dehydrogenase
VCRTLSPEIRRIREEARRVVEAELQPHDAAIDATGQIPPAALDALRRFGFFGLNTARRYGGLGLDMLGACVAISELAKAHIAYYYTSGVNVHLASKGIELDGSEGQRRRWLPELASGRVVGAFALTETEAGSDAAAVRTTAARDGTGYRLHGRKRYITNAPIAGLFTVFAATAPRSDGRAGLTAFLVERDRPGCTVGALNRMTGGHGSFHAEVILDECRVPAENVIGEPGRGFQTAMKCLNAGRVVWAAYSVGAAERLLDLALDHVTTRRQFGRPLADNQGLQWMLADMAAELHAARLVAHDAAVAYDAEPERRPEVGAMAKLVAGEMVFRLADRTMQLFGGAGYCADHPVERIWRDVRAIRILDGTSEILRNVVARRLLTSGRNW